MPVDTLPIPKENGQWIFKDINQDEFSEIEDIKRLSKKQIAGLSAYTLGNIAWNRKDWDGAIAYYTTAILLYPENARFYYNKAGLTAIKETRRKKKPIGKKHLKEILLG